MTPTTVLSGAAHDVRYALRALGRSRGFTATVVLTLTLGLTGTIAMFALVDGVLLRPLPMPAEEQLFVGWRGRAETGARRWPFTPADLDLIRAESPVVAAVAGVGYNGLADLLLADGGDPFVIRAARVTGSFFDVLGVPPFIGRTLRPEDDRAGTENVLVLTRRLWQRHFGSRPDIVGHRVTVAGQPFTIVGVMSDDVDHPRHVEAWMSVAAMLTTTSNATARLGFATELDLLVRLRPGVTAAQADEALRALGPAIDVLRPAGDGRGFVPQLQAFREFVIGDVREALVLLFSAVGFVLLIACANVASLMLVRGDTRRAEFAVRATLGAGRGRLVRQQLVEGTLLTALAAALAVGLVAVLLPAVSAWVPDGLPRAEAVRLDLRVVAFAVGLAGLVAALAAVLPALSSTGPTPIGQLKHASRGVATAGRSPWRRAIVAGQVALGLVGLVGVVLLATSLRQLRDEAQRLSADELVIAPLVVPPAKYEAPGRWREFVTTLTESVAADERVTAATPVNVTPFDGTGWDVPVFAAEGQADDEARRNPPLNLEEVHPSYFQTFEMPVLRGRAFTASDRDDSPRVAIVSADVAARVWPGQDPLGRRVTWGLPGPEARWMTIVGITAPTRYRSLPTPRPTLYVPAAQMLGRADKLVVRTAIPIGALADLVRARARSLDPDVQVLPLRPFGALLEEPFSRPRFYSVLMTGFGVTGVALAAIGLYGVMAAAVRSRRRELGIRLALGAATRDVRRLVLSDGATIVGVGLALGLTACLFVTTALRSLLYGVHPLDPWSLTAAVAGVVVVAALALVAPLRTASRVDPVEILRAE